MNTIESIKLDQDIKIIVNTLLDNFNGVQAIVLCGSYGRNEGGWIYKTDSNVLPYNDYDILVITESIYNGIEVNNIKKILLQKIDIKWIDIEFCSQNRMNKLKTTVKNYDLIFESKVIYGELNLSDKIRKMNPKKISFRDIETLYFTRLWTFLGTVENGFRNLDCEEAMFFRNQMAKAILASVDVLLIKNKSYTSSYKNKVEMIHKFTNCDNYLDFVDWAVNEKIHPTYTPMKEESMKDLYFKTHRFFTNLMKSAFGLRGLFIHKPRYSYLYFFTSPYHLSRIIYHSLIQKNNDYMNYVTINILQNYVFNALGTEMNAYELINEACKIYNKLLKNSFEENYNIYELAGRVAYTRNNL